MRLKLQTDYALRILLFLAGQPDRHCSLAEIARSHAISHNHLTKVAHELVKAGYLASVRGRLGGMRLARAPEAINIGAVVRLMECDLDVVDCANCVIARACGLRGVLAQAVSAFLGILDGYTLAEVLKHQPSLFDAQPIREQ